ncbi:hypothetical protein ACFQV2_16870 [Actinokineospora soli]|uniref:YtxH-like protein n=1 Tax=Actinokineospora soli TaxID=1048753 RepID=A0ABW2TP59_9PSEU
MTRLLWTCAAGVVLGLLGGYLGSRYGAMLRNVAPTTTEVRDA